MGNKIKLVDKGRCAKFMCPACKEVHILIVEGPGKWEWNGSLDKPTFTPSILLQSGHYAPHFTPNDNCWCKFYKENPHLDNSNRFHCVICHSYVTDGKIQYLNDCTHALRGQTVDLPDLIR